MNSAQILKKFEEYLLFEQRLSKNTVLAYCSDLEQYASFLKKKGKQSLLKSLSSPYLISYFSFLAQPERKITSTSLLRKQSSLKAFIRFAQGKFLSKANLLLNESFQIPKTFVLAKKSFFLPIILSQEVLKNFINSCLIKLSNLNFLSSEQDFVLYRDWLLLLFLAVFGLRISEAISLLVTSVNLESKTLRVFGKGQFERILPMPQSVLAPIQKYLTFFEGSGKLFPATRKSTLIPLNRSYLFSLVKRCAKKYSFPYKFSPHSFRHSIASSLLSSGANLREIQTFLGHKSIATVQIYLHTDFSFIHSSFKNFHPRA